MKKIYKRKKMKRKDDANVLKPCTKTINDLYEGLFTELVRDILESEIKWTLDNIINNNASGVNQTAAKLFKLL